MIKTAQEIAIMRDGGALLAAAVRQTLLQVRPGITTYDLNLSLEQALLQRGLGLECKGYEGFPAAACISVNSEVVHGIPSKTRVLKSGDYVKLDVVGRYNGLCVDMTRTCFVGDVDVEVGRLDDVAKQALEAAIAACLPGKRVGDVARAVQQVVESAGFFVVKNFFGHGIGHKMHESPIVPNYVDKRKLAEFGVANSVDVLLRPGMTLAIEPMILAKDSGVSISQDGWTAVADVGCMAAHVEDTVLIREEGRAEILTQERAYMDDLRW